MTGEMMSDMMEDGDDMDIDDEAEKMIQTVEKEIGGAGGGGGQ